MSVHVPDPVELVLAVECPNFRIGLHPCRGCVGGSCGTNSLGYVYCEARIRSALGQGQGESGLLGASPLRATVQGQEDGIPPDSEVWKWTCPCGYFVESILVSDMTRCRNEHIDEHRKQDTRSAEGAKESASQPPTPVK